MAANRTVEDVATANGTATGWIGQPWIDRSAANGIKIAAGGTTMDGTARFSPCNEPSDDEPRKDESRFGRIISNKSGYNRTDDGKTPVAQASLVEQT